MRVSVVRKNVKFIRDLSRVVAKYFMKGESMTQKMVARIMTLVENHFSHNVEHTLHEFPGRHRNISCVFSRHCSNIQDLIKKLAMEYAIESAAFFFINPSIEEDFDQTFRKRERKE